MAKVGGESCPTSDAWKDGWPMAIEFLKKVEKTSATGEADVRA